MKAGGLHRRPPWLGESQGQARQAKHCFRTMGEPGHSTINRQKKKEKKKGCLVDPQKHKNTKGHNFGLSLWSVSISFRFAAEVSNPLRHSYDRLAFLLFGAGLFFGPCCEGWQLILM